MPHYSNARRIAMSGYALFGSAVADSPTGPFTRNNSTWPGTVYDFTGYAVHRVQSSVNTTNWGGTLITPRTVVSAVHVAADVTVGTQFVFLDRNGDTVTRTVTARSGITFGTVIGGDILLLTLDEAVANCAIYRIPTAGSVASLYGTTMICPRRNRVVITRTIESGANYLQHVADSTGGALGADSGQPGFTTVGGELVFLGTHLSATTLTGLAPNLSAMQAYCDTVGETIQTVSVDPADWAKPLEPIEV